jgi:uncharacterized membrane protein YczE
MIEPGFEILFGFILAFCAYFAVTQDIAKIAGLIGVVSFFIGTFVAFSNNDISGIITNYAFFLLGTAFGGIGSAIFNTIANR